MRTLRSCVRLVLFLAVTFTLYLMRVLARPFLTRRADQRWRRTIFRWWGRVNRRVVGMRVRINGPLPGQPCFLVTNHLTYLDILLLSGFLPAVFVSKAEVADWPVVGRIVSSMGTVYIDRTRKRDIRLANASIEAALDRGDGVVLFAEGTSSRGDEVLPMKPSLLDIPATRRFPVSYAAIRYTTPAGNPEAGDIVCWWDDTAFATHFVRLLGLPRFEANVRFGDGTVVENDRKQLARRLHTLISAEYAEAG